MSYIAVERPEVVKLVRETKCCLNCGTWLPRGHGKRPRTGYCCRECYLAKSPVMAWLEHVHGKPIRELVIETLNNQPNKTVAAELLGIQRQNLNVWIKKLGIKKVQKWA